MPSAARKTWKVFWDLQCPYSRINWTKYDALQKAHGAEYEFSIHLTSLVFHPQAFTAQCAANLVQNRKGDQAKWSFINSCFEHQDKYMNDAVGDSRPSQIDEIFATIAQDAGLFDDTLTREDFLANLHDWQDAVKPAYEEHKYALSYQVYGTPKHVIDEKLVEDTESSWGPAEWSEKLKTL